MTQVFPSCRGAGAKHKPLLLSLWDLGEKTEHAASPSGNTFLATVMFVKPWKGKEDEDKFLEVCRHFPLLNKIKKNPTFH